MKAKEKGNLDPSLFALACSLAAGLLYFDLSLPLGIAAGFPYIVVVLLGWRFAAPRSVFWLAALCTVLITAGYWLSPPGSVPIHGAVNRAMAVCAIWIVAALLFRARRAEEELRESGTSLVLAQEIARIGSWDWNIRTGGLKWSDGIYHIFGLTPQEFGATYDAFLERVHPADRAQVEEAVQQAVHDDRPYSIEHRVVRPDGTERVVYERGKVFRDADGRAERMLGVVQDITEHRWVEEELRASQRLLQTVFDTIPMGVFVKDTERRYVMVNRASTERHDFSAEDLIGLRAEQVSKWSDAEKQAALKEDTRVLEEGIVVDQPGRRFVDSGGKTVWHRTIRTPLHNDDGKIIGLVGVREDITERKGAEGKLRESQQLLQTVFDTLPVRVLVRDREGGIVMVNKAHAALLNLSPEEFQKLPDKFPVLREEDAGQFEALHREVVEQGRSIDHEGFQKWRNGAEGFHRTIRVPLRDADGNITGSVVVAEDITARKKAEQELRRFKTTLDATRDTVFMFEPDSLRFFYTNRGASEQVGYSREELLEMTPLDIKPEFDEPRFREFIAPLLAGEQPVITFETLHRHKTGRDIPVEIALQYVNPDGEEPRFIAIVRDLSERKAVEERLRQKQKLEAIGQLAGGVAHEFNNLLQMILGFTELTLDATSAGDGRFKHLKMIRDAANKGAKLVRQLLGYSRRQQLDSEVCDVNDLIGSSLTMLMATLGPDVPLLFRPGADVKPIRADAGSIEQALINLCINAHDAMPDGGQVVIETANAGADAFKGTVTPPLGNGDYVRISVSDNGVGMPPEVVDRIFDPFFTTKGPQEGTGLGLSLVFGFINQQGGLIDVSSTVGVGTTFHLYLPASTDQPGADGKLEPADNRLEARPANGKKGTVLVAEDEEGVRQFAVGVLEAEGYRVLSARDGAEAVRLFEQEGGGIDLVLLDVVMPNMGGRATCERILALRPEVPVVFHTAHGLGKGEAKALAGEGHRLLMKPYPASALRELVHEVLDIEGG
jgi:PAS domain S-box-containing protein